MILDVIRNKRDLCLTGSTGGVLHITPYASGTYRGLKKIMVSLLNCH